MTTINDWSIMPHEVKAHEIKYSDNIYWYGNLYTVLAVTPDWKDETIEFKVGYPRKIEGDYPILNTITTQIQKPILVYR